MTTPTDLSLDIFHQTRKTLQGAVRKYISNKEIPLDERWATFLKAGPELLEYEPWITGAYHGLPQRDDLTDCEYRGSLVSFVNNYEQVLDALDDQNSDETDDDWSAWVVGLDPDDFRERILQNGYYGYTFDW